MYCSTYWSRLTLLSIFYLPGRCWSFPQLSWGKGRGTPRTSYQFMAGHYGGKNSHWHAQTQRQTIYSFKFTSQACFGRWDEATNKPHNLLAIYSLPPSIAHILEAVSSKIQTKLNLIIKQKKSQNQLFSTQFYQFP